MPLAPEETPGAPLSARETERLRRTWEALPDDLATGLEIGFLDFRVTERLRQKVDLVSIDLPKEVGDRRGRQLVFADVQNLPFRDASFDIVICTEVLEHLPESALRKGVRELGRVSRKYLLVSVPFKQRVWNEMFKCSRCGHLSNTMDHKHYFDDRRLLSLFPGAAVLKTDFIATIHGYAPDWLYKVAQRIGNVWNDLQYGDCPNCRQSRTAVRPNIIGYLLERIIWRWQRSAQPRPAWVLMLLKVANQSAPGGVPRMGGAPGRSFDAPTGHCRNTLQLSPCPRFFS